MISFEGGSLLERLQGLDEMHDRVKLAMPHLAPPSFEFEESAYGAHRLHDFSHRDGLQPMVMGLLHRLPEETGDRIAVHIVESRNASADHDVFEIRMQDAARSGEIAARGRGASGAASGLPRGRRRPSHRP